MPNIKFTATKFKLDKTRFTQVLSNRVITAMRDAAKASLLANFSRIPVWTGESRGALRELARGLELSIADLDIHPVDKTRKTKSGETKSPTSPEGNSKFSPFRRTSDNKIIFSYGNFAEGFEANDTKFGAANLHHSGPWRFRSSFSRGMKQRALELFRAQVIPVLSFSLRQRVTS